MAAIVRNQSTFAHDEHSRTLLGERDLYRLGGLAAVVCLLVTLLDIGLTFLPAAASPEPGSATPGEWYQFIQSNWFFGLRGLGSLNIVVSSMNIFLFAALFVAHRKTKPISGALAFILLSMGAIIYIANNPALGMLQLSREYFAAPNDQKYLVMAAGQALLAQAEDFTPGAFWGFFFNLVGNVWMALVLLRGQVFCRSAGWCGVLGSILLFVFTTWATFVPGFFPVMMLVAIVGGLFSQAWYALVARHLFRMSATN